MRKQLHIHMRITAFLICLLFVTDLIGQNLIEGHPKWYVRHTDAFFGPPPYPESSIVFRIGQKDTIGGTVQYNIEMSRDSLETEWQNTGFHLHQKGDTVWYNFSEGDHIEDGIFFIYNWDVGHSYESCFQTYELLRRDTFINQGIAHTFYVLYEGSKGPYGLIEGMGMESFIFPEWGYCATDQGNYELRCFYRNDSLVYKKDPDVSCFSPPFIPTATYGTQEPDVEIENTLVSVGQKIRFKNLDRGLVEMINFNGTVESSITYPVEDLFAISPGPKLIKVTDQKGTSLLRIMVVGR